jgi:hypothetical protein
VRAALSWLAVAAASLGLGGCPRECGADSEVVLVAHEEDPNLGAFEGSLTWLQTAEETTLRVSITTEATSTTKSCDSAQVNLVVAAETTDGALHDIAQHMMGNISDAGLLVPSNTVLTLDLRPLLEGGKLVDAPGIENRNPSATLSLEPQPDGTWSATITVRSATDRLTVGVATLARAGA